MQAQLVDRAGAQELLRRVGAAGDQDVLAARGRLAHARSAAADARGDEAGTCVGPFTSGSRPRLVTTNVGRPKAPSSPQGPMPTSNIRRPITTAPAVAYIASAAARSSAVGSVPSNPIHRCRRSPAVPNGRSTLTPLPATNPSTDGLISAITLLICAPCVDVIAGVDGFARADSSA